LDLFPLVKWDSNTISKKDSQLTTLNALADIVELISLSQDIKISSDDSIEAAPNAEDLQKAIDATLQWLNLFFQSIPAVEAMRHDPNLIAIGRDPEKPFSLLLKPVGLTALFHAAVMALDPEIGGMSDINEVFRRLAKVDWSLSASTWKNVIINSKGNISNRRADLDLAAEIAVWLICGRNCAKQFQTDLEDKFKRQFNRPDATLPAPVFA
jgi:hypothetical protein